MPSVRRFPSPWTAEETEACFIVRDANGQALAYVYFQDEPGRRAAAKLLTRDEARRIAANIAKLSELLTAPVRKWTGNDAPHPRSQVSFPRSPAGLRRAGLSLAADPQ